MSFDTDYTFLMNNEDRSQSHAIVPDAPPGAHAISGINSAAFPTDFANIAAIPQSQRGPAVEQFYKTHFWNSWMNQISSDDVAERLLDAGVNMGLKTAVKLIQTAVTNLGNTVVIDGGFGPGTLAAVNSCDPTALVAEFRSLRIAHYEAIVASNPEDAQYEAQWLKRARE